MVVNLLAVKGLMMRDEVRMGVFLDGGVDNILKIILLWSDKEKLMVSRLEMFKPKDRTKSRIWPLS